MNKKTASEYLSHINEHSTLLLLLLLLCADLAAIALHSINSLTPFLKNPFLSLSKDGGYPETYQYLKWFWIVVLLVYISISRRTFGYAVWGLVFTYFLCDDALQIHERVGNRIAWHLTVTPPLGLKFQDLGELAVSAAAGVILLSLVAWAYSRGSQAFKKISQDLLLLILALVLFGVVFDMAHSAIRLGWKVEFILGVIEDGGEMLVASLILGYVFGLSARAENTISSLGDFVGAQNRR